MNWKMLDYSLENFMEESISEKINLLAGLADGRHLPETHWPLFWKVFQELSKNPDHPADRNAVAQMLIQSYHRFTVEQKTFIRDDEYALRKQWVLEWWVEDWQEKVLKQTVQSKN